MATSEARINANRQNSARSTGPRTAEGKEVSRRNGLKHGMTGQGVVLLDEDAAEVESRCQTLMIEMAPATSAGEILVREMATLSVRMERGARQELASVAERVRHASTRHDEEQIVRAEQLLLSIGDTPRSTLRRLKRTPEGVDVLIDAWRDLRVDLARAVGASWDTARMAKMANLMGLRVTDIRGTRDEGLSMASWGHFVGLADADGADLTREERQRWARATLVGRVDEEIARLEAHLETLDLDAFELDRVQAGDRALFDPSKDAGRARRYEAEARRGFYRALHDFRLVEAEALARGDVAPNSPVEAVVRPPDSLGSSCEAAGEPVPAAVELAPPPLWPPSAAFSKGGPAPLDEEKPALVDGRPALASVSRPARASGHAGQ